MGWLWRLQIENCTGCGICFDVCEFDAIEMHLGMAYPAPIDDACTGCLTCVEECPFEAIEVREALSVA